MCDDKGGRTPPRPRIRFHTKNSQSNQQLEDIKRQTILAVIKKNPENINMLFKTLLAATYFAAASLGAVLPQPNTNKLISSRSEEVTNAIPTLDWKRVKRAEVDSVDADGLVPPPDWKR